MRLILLTVEAQAVDALTFTLAVSRLGIGGESNAGMAGLYAAGGLPAVLAVKGLGAVLLALLAWRLAPRRIALLPAIVGLVGAVTNLGALA